ncbi:MAG: GNAT family N-acetyltransferase, partial [Methylocystis sp.]|nr:GNAT family N-acetyltransferase [Methylocystis sp.]
MTNNVDHEKLSLAIGEDVECATTAAALGAEIAARFGPRDERPLSLTLCDEAGELVAGLNGLSHWRWLYVRHLWV